MQPPPLPTVGQVIRLEEAGSLQTRHALGLGNRLRALIMHKQDERPWNSQLTAALQVPVTVIDEVLGKTLDIQIAQETNMSNKDGDVWALGVEEKTFTDMTLQRKMREIVKQKKKTAKPNSRVGMYVPDFCTYIGNHYPGTAPLYHVASLVGEVKVTQLEQRGQKWTVRIDPEGDPELAQLLDIQTHWTLSTPNPHSTIAEVAAADMKKKWKLGVSKAIIYLMTLFEWSGGYLAFVVVGSRFSRLIALGQRHVLIETAGEPRTLALPEFVDGEVDLPWDLAIPLGPRPTVANPVLEAAQVNRQSYDRLMDVVRLSIQVLESQPLRPPFRRIELPDDDLTPTLVENRIIGSKATKLSWDVESDEALIVAGREDLWGPTDKSRARGRSPNPPPERDGRKDDDEDGPSSRGEADGAKGHAQRDVAGGQKRPRDGDDDAADQAADRRVTRARGATDATDMTGSTSGAPLKLPPDLVASEHGSPPSSPLREPATPPSPTVPGDPATFSSPTAPPSPSSPMPCFTLPEYEHVSTAELQRLLDTGEYFPVGRTDMLRLINLPEYEQASDADMLELALGLGDITVTAVSTSKFDTCLRELSDAVEASAPAADAGN